MSIQIRKYKEEDFDPVTRLWRRSREVSLPDFQREKGHPFEKDQWYFREHVLPKDEILIAEVDGQMAGFMAMRDDFVDFLYIDPDYWRKGIGSALLDFVRARSPRHLWLYTLQVNHVARTFYQKQGFKATHFGISPAPELEPDVEYHWMPQD